MGSAGAWADQTDVGDRSAITVFDDASSSSTRSIPFRTRNSDLLLFRETSSVIALFSGGGEFRDRFFPSFFLPRFREIWNPEEESVLDTFETLESSWNEFLLSLTVSRKLNVAQEVKNGALCRFFKLKIRNIFIVIQF